MTQQPHPEPTCPSLADFEFLAWLERACLFRDDMRRRLLELGLSDDVAFTLSTSDAVKKGSIVALYQDYALGDEGELRAGFHRFIQDCWEKHQAATQRVREALGPEARPASRG